LPVRRPLKCRLLAPAASAWEKLPIAVRIVQRLPCLLALLGLPQDLPYEVRMRNIDGRLWFPDYATSEIGQVTTAGLITEYTLPEGSKPIGITAGTNNSMWFTDFGTNEVGEIVP
jgi:hypothetical protein